MPNTSTKNPRWQSTLGAWTTKIKEWLPKKAKLINTAEQVNEEITRLREISEKVVKNTRAGNKEKAQKDLANAKTRFFTMMDTLEITLQEQGKPEDAQRIRETKEQIAEEFQQNENKRKQYLITFYC